MIGSWDAGLYLLKSINEVLTAGIAITAFSLFLYALQFNIRDKVTRTFTFILVSIVIAYSAEAIGSALTLSWGNDTWLRLEWVGIILLPAVYFHFSDALLAKTGKPSKGKRTLVNWLAYLVSFGFLLTLPSPNFFGVATLEYGPTPYLQPSIINILFALYYVGMITMSWFNFYRSFMRTKTPTSRRRVFYLILGALAPAFGTFPYMLFGYGFASRHSTLFWMISIASNILMSGLIIVMAYAVSFFGVSWPDRVVRSRLAKWILRGPGTAIVTLGLVTATRRIGEYFGIGYTTFVPIVMAATITVFQYLITLFFPLMDRKFLNRENEQQMGAVRSLETRFITDHDLRQFLESLLAAICDLLQVPGAFIATFENGSSELLVHIGSEETDQENLTKELQKIARENGFHEQFFKWGDDFIVPLNEEPEEEDENTGKGRLLGLMCIRQAVLMEMDDEQRAALDVLILRAEMALRDHLTQKNLLLSLKRIEPEVDLIHRIQAAGRFDGRNMLIGEPQLPPEDMSQWVKEALTHYWGGPKLTESPLLDLKVVKDAVEENEGSQANALRSILKKGIERVKPDGERRFTGEWILYNILDMKFLEGRKVREIALRLAVSEADLYRKQRVAIESVAKEISEMEEKARNQAS